jgi:phage gp36-like protein
MAAYHSAVGIDSQTDYLRNLHNEAIAWLRDISTGKVDLGIPDPRPAHIAPHAMVVRGLSRGRGCY